MRSCRPGPCAIPLRAAITLNMFFHLERHLFPRVPTARLHLLARRIDAASSAGALETGVVSRLYNPDVTARQDPLRVRD